MRSSTLIIILFFIGCSSTYKVAEDPSIFKDRVFSYEQVQEKIEREKVEIICNDKKLIFATHVRITCDSISFLNNLDSLQMNLPVSTVSIIRRRLYSDGATEGFVFGALSGCALGLGVAAFNVDDGEMSALGALVFGIGGMLAGCTVGTTWGASRGHTVEYQFVKDSIIIR